MLSSCLNFLEVISLGEADSHTFIGIMKDFAFFSMAEEKIVVLMKSEEGEATCLSVRNLRTMEPEYTLSLAKFIHLVDSPPNQVCI